MYFGSPYLGIVLAVICGLGCLYRFFGYKQPYYTFSLVTFMRPNLTYNSRFVKKIILLLRFITLVFLCFIVAQPQIPGALQRLPVEGIEIFIALDLSASMNAVDDQRDTRRRVEIARDEAINFIKQRPFDAIGLSVFGANSLVRCPLTHDHASLISIIKSTDVSNTVFPDGTVLAIGLTSALNKFKDSKARSKVIILLTDGAPTQQDIPIGVPLDLAKELGVKVYTIGIGSTAMPQFFGFAQPPVNVDLLKKIADESGGSFFMAKNATDMKLIYDQINKLEKQEMNPLGSAIMHDNSATFMLLACLFFLLEFIVSRLFLRSLI